MFAELEDNLWKSIGRRTNDPILEENLASLKWIDRRVHLADGNKTLKIVLRIPSLLHPAKTELKETVRDVAKEELSQWIAKHNLDLKAEIAVELLGSKPVPNLARFVENHEELVKQLGPGLVNVSQYLAIYSCKGGKQRNMIRNDLFYVLFLIVTNFLLIVMLAVGSVLSRCG